MHTIKLIHYVRVDQTDGISLGNFKYFIGSFPSNYHCIPILPKLDKELRVKGTREHKEIKTGRVSSFLSSVTAEPVERCGRKARVMSALHGKAVCAGPEKD